MSESISTDRRLFKEVSIILIIKVMLLFGLWYAFFSDPLPDLVTTEHVAERIAGAASR